MIGEWGCNTPTQSIGTLPRFFQSEYEMRLMETRTGEGRVWLSRAGEAHPLTPHLTSSEKTPREPSPIL